MPGRTTGDNRFGPSPWVVGPVLGDGCNYLTIQEAINDAAAVGGGQVLIRGSTYTEDLALGTNVNLIGVDVSGVASDVVIIGNHTYTGTGAISFEAINFQCGAGTDVFNVTPTAPGLALIFSACDIDASSVSNGNGVVGNVSVAVLSIVATDTRVRSDLHCFQLDGFSQMVFKGTCTSTNGNVILATSAYQLRYEDSFAASNVIGNFDLAGTGTFFANHVRLQSQQETFTIAAGSEVQCTNAVIASDAGSGFFATGTGTLRYADLSLSGAAIVIDPALTTLIYDWKPYAVEATAPGGGFARGTACFDDTQFSVTDGFVQFTGTAVPTTFTTDSGTATPAANNVNVVGGTGSLITAAGDTITVNSPLWSVVGASTTLAVNTGSIVNIGPSGTLTLPFGVGDGKVIEIMNSNNSTITVQCAGGDIIRLGNLSTSINGTATSLLAGDWLRLVYFNAAGQWLSAGIVGNWTLA